jgi:hypothetical protein
MEIRRGFDSQFRAARVRRLKVNPNPVVAAVCCSRASNPSHPAGALKRIDAARMMSSVAASNRNARVTDREPLASDFREPHPARPQP